MMVDIAIAERLERRLLVVVAQMYLGHARSSLSQQRVGVHTSVKCVFEIQAQSHVIGVSVSENMAPLARILHHFRGMVVNSKLKPILSKHAAHAVERLRLNGEFGVRLAALCRLSVGIVHDGLAVKFLAQCSDLQTT